AGRRSTFAGQAALERDPHVAAADAAPRQFDARLGLGIPRTGARAARARGIKKRRRTDTEAAHPGLKPAPRRGRARRYAHTLLRLLSCFLCPGPAPRCPAPSAPPPAPRLEPALRSNTARWVPAPNMGRAMRRNCDRARGRKKHAPHRAGPAIEEVNRRG